MAGRIKWKNESERLPRQNDIRVEEVPRPHAGFGEAVIRITLTTICGTDLQFGRVPCRRAREMDIKEKRQ